MKPFRWSLGKREQLGGLLDETGAPNIELYGFIDEIRRVSARILALGGDAGFAFLGRTPENFFDYLSGISDGLDDAPPLHLIHFSLRWAGQGGVESLEPKARRAFFDYLHVEGVGPERIAKGHRRLILVDFVAGGGTMENFVRLLKMHADEEGTDWNAVQRKLGIVAIRTRTKNSPNTWRWQQHQTWLHLIPDALIRNVSANPGIIYGLANIQPKTTPSHHPARWADTEAGRPELTPERLTALALAVALYDRGRDPDERKRLARMIADAPQMREPTTRRLTLRLKGR